MRCRTDIGQVRSRFLCCFSTCEAAESAPPSWRSDLAVSRLRITVGSLARGRSGGHRLSRGISLRDDARQAYRATEIRRIAAARGEARLPRTRSACSCTRRACAVIGNLANIHLRVCAQRWRVSAVHRSLDAVMSGANIPSPVLDMVSTTRCESLYESVAKACYAREASRLRPQAGWPRTTVAGTWHNKAADRRAISTIGRRTRGQFAAALASRACLTVARELRNTGRELAANPSRIGVTDCRCRVDGTKPRKPASRVKRKTKICLLLQA